MFDSSATANIFKDFYSNLASNLVSKLPTPPNRFGLTYLSSCYKNLNISENLVFKEVSAENILKILEHLDISKAVGTDNLSSRFLKDGAKIIALPIEKAKGLGWILEEHHMSNILDLNGLHLHSL